jgi:hypothetical protein
MQNNSDMIGQFFENKSTKPTTYYFAKKNEWGCVDTWVWAPRLDEHLWERDNFSYISNWYIFKFTYY